MSCRRFTNECSMELKAKKTFLLDCDGVLWTGNVPVPGSVEAVARLKQLGKRVILVTNNSGRSRASYVEKCKALGFNDIHEHDIVTTSSVLARYLKDMEFCNSKIYIVGSQGIANELTNAGFAWFGVGPDRMDDYDDSMEKLERARFPISPEQVGAVVVGYDAHISFPKALKATTYLSNPGCLYIATNDDETYPTSNPNIVCPGTGSIVSMITTASGRTPVVLGKPNAPMYEYIVNEYGVKAHETVMVGDRLRTDIQFAKLHGMASLLVLTGQSTLDEVELERSRNPNYIPDFYCDRLGDLTNL